MKVLFLAPYPPYPPRGGGQQRMYQFIRYVAREHEVWLLTFSADDAEAAALEPLRTLCKVVTVPLPRHSASKRLRTLITSSLPDMALRGRSAQFRDELKRLLACVPFDVVQAESIEMVQYGSRKVSTPLYVYDAFNAEFVIQQRAFSTDVRNLRKLLIAAYSFLQWRKLRAYEARLDTRFGGLLTVSQEDAAIMKRVAPASRIAVIPNGVDSTFFQPDDASTDGSETLQSVLFTGTLDYRPNIDAIHWFVREVLPQVRATRPAVRFVVVGRNPTTTVKLLGQQDGVEIVGEVEDVRPWFNRAAAYVVPMRIGGGVRLKLLEALAMGKPVISTSMGVEGVDGLVPGVHALVADHPAQFAVHILSVLANRTLAGQLGRASRSFVVQRYDWEAIVPRMVEQWRQWIDQ